MRKAMNHLAKNGGLGTVSAFLLLHFMLSFIGLAWLGESSITGNFATYIYWYLTTTTTVGYGDLSPGGDAGRLFTGIFVMLGGLGLLAAFVATASGNILSIWRSRLKGKDSYENLTNHTLVVGWNGPETHQLLDLLISERSSPNDQIILCDDRLHENPIPSQIFFVRGDSLSDSKMLVRAGAVTAARILVCCKDDDKALAAVLSINAIKSSAHIVAHFNSTSAAELAKQYVPALEISSAMSMELLVRSANDPGTSEIIFDLLNTKEDGHTLLCLKLQPGDSITYSDAALNLTNNNAIPVGIRPQGKNTAVIAPGDVSLGPGDLIYYIAKSRLPKEVICV